MVLSFCEGLLVLLLMVGDHSKARTFLKSWVCVCYVELKYCFFPVLHSVTQ